MQFSFLPYRNPKTGEPQFQCHVFDENDRKVRYVPDVGSSLQVTHSGLWEGTIGRLITPEWFNPRTVTVMVTGEISEPVAEQVAPPKAAELFVGQFIHERHPTKNEMQWKRRLRGQEGQTVVHIVDGRSSNQPTDNTSMWQYRLANKISADPTFEVWTVEVLKEIVVQPTVSERRERNRSARQVRVQERIADLLKTQAERQKFGKELEVRHAGGGKHKSGKGQSKKKEKFANAS